MKTHFSFKKEISGFKPETHWKVVLASAFVLFLAAIGYNAYLYVYAEKQINTMSAATTTPAQVRAFTSPEKVQEYFEVYKEREVRYRAILQILTAGNKPVIIRNFATTSTSTLVATSSNQ